MKKWEYIIKTPHNPNINITLENLNYFGKLGWELVVINTTDEKIQLVFKRELKKKKI